MSFEVKFEDPKRPAPESLLSPRSPIQPEEVKMRIHEKQAKADDRRKSQIDSVVEKQKNHVRE